ncbi:MAG: hypothetical protein ABI142_03970, partial [Bryocella sp.]
MSAALAATSTLQSSAAEPIPTASPAPQYKSPFYALSLSPNGPAFSTFIVDSLGKSALTENMAEPPLPFTAPYDVTHTADTITYRQRTDKAPAPEWAFTFSEKKFTAHSTNAPAHVMHPMTMRFSIESHATLLGTIDEEGGVRLPALLHFPEHGTFRITSSENISLRYDASHDKANFIEITFPDSGRYNHHIEYTFEVVSIYPAANAANLAANPLYDGYRRDFLSMLQLNPRRRCLANNVASDACAFTVFEYAMIAAHLPPLADGLTAISLIRSTLDRYIGGMKGYGMVGYNDSDVIKYDFLDIYPSLVLTAAICHESEPDLTWTKRNYSVLHSWAEKMIAADTDGDGLLEYPVSGNSGSWPEKMVVRPANWWDTIGFGHKDAYSNALAYKAFLSMAELSEAAGYPLDAERYRDRAAKIKAIFYKTFYNPETGVLAGWKSADGHLHDYYFLFI